MYAHEVIQAIATGRLLLSDARPGTRAARDQRTLLEAALPAIRESHKFHFGALETWEDEELLATAIEFAKGDRLLLPYSPVWVDGTINSVGSGARQGALLDYDKDGTISGLMFVGGEGRWSTTGAIVRLDRDKETFLYNTPVPDREARNRKINLHFDVHAYWTFLSAVAALSAAGVEIERRSPPPKLNRRLLKRGKEPRYTYQVLVVDVPGHERRQLGVPDLERLGPRLHWVRGHLRRRPGEGENAPKTVVVRPALRGSAQHGVAEKDYRVRSRARIGEGAG